MFSNYLKIAVRNLLKYKGYSLLNIAGLAVGMACCILMLLYVQDELSYDRYHENADRIYRVSRSWKNPNGEISLHLGHIAPPFGPLMKNDFPETVLDVVRFRSIGTPLVSHGENHFQEGRFFFVDSTVFSMFSWPLLQGDPGSVLTEPNTVVLSESTARKYFGSDDAMGKTLRVNQQSDLKVTGVMRDFPRQSHFTADILVSYITFENIVGKQNLERNWGSNNFATYILVPPGFDAPAFSKNLLDLVDTYMGPDPSGVPISNGTQLNLWRLTDIHLHSNLDSEIEANSDIAYVFIYTAVAVFVLLIACFNFMNLSTAHASRRKKEVGMRKVLGAHRTLLIQQFLGESVFLSFLALILGGIIVELALPWFNSFVGRDLSMNYAGNLAVVFGLLVLTVLVGSVAGSYPAFFLSALKPVSVLKGGKQRGSRGLTFRSVLVVSQFTISIGLLASMLVVFEQLEFVRTKNLGFNKDRVLYLPTSAEIVSRFPEVRAQLLSQPGITDVTVSSRVPSGRLLDSQNTRAEVGGELKNINERIADIHVDHNFMRTYGVSFTAGRDFDINLASDSTEAFILNEASLAVIGWQSAEEAIGRRIEYGNRKGRVVGVVKDFHFESLHQSIVPIIFLINPGRFNAVSMRIAAGHLNETLDFVRTRWRELRPNYPFIPRFVDEQFDAQYRSDERLGEIFGIFAGLAVVIACLGLLGLAAFVSEQRTKEIGVRKVLGATVSGIVVLLSKDFARLIMVGFIVAIPLVFFGMDRWLDGFAYRVAISWLAFAVAGGAALLIALLTVSFHAVKAALSNPVESLRYE
ncbi:MAG: ABC transporter permease [Bacteroidota bacterium]